MVAQRLSWIVAQAHSSKQLRERDFALDFGGKADSAAEQRARWEAMSIRDEIAAGGTVQGDGEHG